MKKPHWFDFILGRKTVEKWFTILTILASFWELLQNSQALDLFPEILI